MARRVEGKVAFITGGARGQGRSHAVTMASEGADVVLLDIDRVANDMDETVGMVKDAGGRCLPIVADVTELHSVDRAVRQTFDTFGRVDIVLANAGILPAGRSPETLDESADRWASVIA